MTKIWTWVKDNFAALLDVATVLIAILVIVFDVFYGASPETVREATLAILSLIGASLLIHHRENIQGRQEIETTTKFLCESVQTNSGNLSQLQRTIEKALGHLPRPSVSQVFLPFGQHVQEIDQRLWLAREVWILARTGGRLRSDFMTNS